MTGDGAEVDWVVGVDSDVEGSFLLLGVKIENTFDGPGAPKPAEN